MQSPVEDFHCALQKKICLQGRLYLFQQHVCFYSNLFGFAKSKVIPLQVMLVYSIPRDSIKYVHHLCTQSQKHHAILMQDVTNVSKRKNIGFPNSIEITWTSQGRAKHDFFTSFLHRREAYKMVVSAWANCRSPPLHALLSFPCAVPLLRLLATLCLLPAVHLVSSTCQHKAKRHPQAAHVSLHSTTVAMSSPHAPLHSAQPGHSSCVPFVAHVLLIVCIKMYMGQSVYASTNTSHM